MSTIELNVLGVEVILNITTPPRYQAAYTSGLPEDCFPAEYDPAEWEVSEDNEQFIIQALASADSLTEATSTVVEEYYNDLTGG